MLLNRHLSLFSPRAISEKQHRGLLVQFILFELLECYKAYLSEEDWNLILSPHPKHFPYDWSAVTGFFNKAQEHILLLKDAFPDASKAIKAFDKEFSKSLAILVKKKKMNRELFLQTLKKILSALEPLIDLCKDNENLIHFFLKNKDSIDGVMGPGYLHALLLKVHACGLETLGEKMCDRYHQRGFFSQISEFKILLTELSHG